MVDVPGRFFARQRLEVITARDALRKLSEIVPCQQFPQFGLPDEYDLQQLLLRRLEIGQQAHLFEHVPRKILRLIHDQDRAPAIGMRHEQMVIQCIDQ